MVAARLLYGLVLAATAAAEPRRLFEILEGADADTSGIVDCHEDDQISCKKVRSLGFQLPDRTRMSGLSSQHNSLLT